MKKIIFITGVAGFIGSHIANDLINDFDIIGIDDLSSGKIENLSKIIQNHSFSFIHSSIQNCKNLDEIYQQSELIIHLASSVGILKTYQNPLFTLENNIYSSSIIIEQCLKFNKRLILASSSEIYGSQEVAKIDENSKSTFANISSLRMSYTIPKMIDELKLNIYKNNGLSSTIVRFFNVIGPNQTSRFGMVVPRFIKQAISGEPITIYGDGSQIRTFCDIRDIIKAVRLIVYSPNLDNNVFNIGGNQEVSINKLADIVLELTNSKSQKIYIPYSQVHEDYEEIYYRKPSIKKMNEKFGWKPEISIIESLNNIIDCNYSIYG